MGFGSCVVPKSLVTQPFFKQTHADDGALIIGLVWSVCTGTDLWRMVALKTDQVMEQKHEFIPEWVRSCVSHMMLAGSVEQSHFIITQRLVT